MIKSMTGYGKGEATDSTGRCVVEIRTVNNRYSELLVKMPRSFMAFENDVRKAAGLYVKRGKADIFVQWEPATGELVMPSINHAVAKGYRQAFLDLAHELHLSADIPLSLIISQKNVLQDSVAEIPGDLLPALLLAVNQALENLDSMRICEGNALMCDLESRRQLLEELKKQIMARSPAVVEEYRVRLGQRLERLLAGAEVDPQRLATEVAILADRCDITEELVRLDSHFKQFDNALLMNEPVGRKLDFLMQEINREVNTIGSKANDSEITGIVVQMKAELEKMREQVQNIE